MNRAERRKMSGNNRFLIQPQGQQQVMQPQVIVNIEGFDRLFDREFWRRMFAAMVVSANLGEVTIEDSIHSAERLLDRLEQTAPKKETPNDAVSTPAS